MLKTEAWRKRLKDAGFRLVAEVEPAPPQLRHAPGSYANHAPAPCPGCGRAPCACEPAP